MDTQDITKITGKPISGISIDSRAIKKGDVFVAIKGEVFDGHDFVDEAIDKGAAAVVVSAGFRHGDCGVPLISVPDTKEALAILARDFYGNPSAKIKVIGITGTNGKTTTSYLAESIFTAAGRKAARLGTIDYKIGDRLMEAVNTTPSSLVLNRLLKEMVESSCDYVCLEVSSHSLEQRRVEEILFDVGVFTNITPEHLDYHKSFEGYLEAKKILFSRLRHDASAVLNIDDRNFENIRRAVSAKRVMSFGIGYGADVAARDLKMDLDGTEFLLVTKRGDIPVKTSLMGRHNVSNILAAAGAALAEGVGLDSIKKGIESLKEVPGRLEPVKAKNDFRIFIDYAHTDDALKNVLEMLNTVKRNRLIVVFGCGGERDRSKRPRMGKVAARLADFVVITTDNPRNEDPGLIAEEIRQGIREDFKDYEVVLDRREAIEKALSTADSGDIVLIAGKGHEKYQIIGDRKIPFSDREAVKEIYQK